MQIITTLVHHSKQNKASLGPSLLTQLENSLGPQFGWRAEVLCLFVVLAESLQGGEGSCIQFLWAQIVIDWDFRARHKLFEPVAHFSHHSWLLGRRNILDLILELKSSLYLPTFSFSAHQLRGRLLLLLGDHLSIYLVHQSEQSIRCGLIDQAFAPLLNGCSYCFAASRCVQGRGNWLLAHLAGVVLVGCEGLVPVIALQQVDGDVHVLQVEHQFEVLDCDRNFCVRFLLFWLH